MAPKNLLLSSKEHKDLESVAVFLSELADKLVDGQLVLRQGANEVQIDLPGTVTLKMKAKKAPTIAPTMANAPSP